MTSNYKILGQFVDSDGSAVLGQNDAGSGTPVGVEGVVPNSADGFGLATPDDALIEGGVETTGDWELRAGDESTGDAGNVIAGHADNLADFDPVGATIGGGGYNDSLTGTYEGNVVNDDYATVAGGRDNEAGAAGTADDPYPTVGGGYGNYAGREAATVAGGSGNEARARFSTVGGGNGNIVRDYGGTVGGGVSNFLGLNAMEATVAGGRDNEVSGEHGTVGGGTGNTAGAAEATVAGGNANTAGGDSATVAGGQANAASGSSATVAGGFQNSAGSNYDSVGGGYDNVADGGAATVAGGYDNAAHTARDAIGGGQSNRTGTSGATTPLNAVVPGGRNNVVEGQFGLAAGRQAEALDDGAFVWADSTNARFGSDQAGTGSSPTGPDTFHVRATGGLRLVTGLDGGDDPNAGQFLPGGGGGWQTVSARSAKRNVEPVDYEGVLDGVEGMAVTTWEYESNEGVRRMGPMAGEFHDAFGLGEDPETIGHVDADGVALAAIRGLAQRLDRKDDRIEALEAETERLRAETERLRERDADLAARLAAVENDIDDGEAVENDIDDGEAVENDIDDGEAVENSRQS